MVQKSGVHQLRLVVYPIIYMVLYIPGGDRRISEPSTVSIWEVLFLFRHFFHSSKSANRSLLMSFFWFSFSVGGLHVSCHLVGTKATLLFSHRERRSGFPLEGISAYFQGVKLAIRLE